MGNSLGKLLRKTIRSRLSIVATDQACCCQCESQGPHGEWNQRPCRNSTSPSPIPTLAPTFVCREPRAITERFASFNSRRYGRLEHSLVRFVNCQEYRWPYIPQGQLPSCFTTWFSDTIVFVVYILIKWWWTDIIKCQFRGRIRSEQRTNDVPGGL